MTDAPDCTTNQVLLEEINVHQHYSEPKDFNKKQTINLQDFTPSDLELFVDSMETIARLRKLKYERRQKPEIKEFQEAFENAKKTVSYWDSSMIFTSYDEDDNANTSHFNFDKTIYSMPDDSICQLSNIKEKFISFSTTTFPNNRELINQTASLKSEMNKCVSSKALYININENSNSAQSSSTTQETEDADIYLYNGHAAHFYEEILPLQPHSIVINQPKSKSLKSRFTSLIKKKQGLTTELTPVNNVPSTASFDENAEYSEIYEYDLNDVSQFGKRSKSTRKVKSCIKKKRRNYSTNQKFLEKAMRFLTL